MHLFTIKVAHLEQGKAGLFFIGHMELNLSLLSQANTEENHISLNDSSNQTTNGKWLGG